MYADPHVASLEMKHAHLDEAIAAEVHRPSPDTVKITKLKREKLRLKEEINRFVGR